MKPRLDHATEIEVFLTILITSQFILTFSEICSQFLNLLKGARPITNISSDIISSRFYSFQQISVHILSVNLQRRCHEGVW